MSDGQVLEVTYEVDIPLEISLCAKQFYDNAQIGSRGWASTVVVGNKDTGLLHAQKNNQLSQWVDDRGVKFGRRLSSTISALSESLAILKLSCDVAKRHIKGIELRRDNLIDVAIGKSKRTILFNNSSAPEFGRMRVYAKIPMPLGFQDQVNAFIENADKDTENKVIFVGDHVSGYIHAKKHESGLWECLGEGDLNYEEIISGKSMEEVISILATDLAALDLSEEAISKHVRRHHITENNLVMIEVGGRDEPFSFDK